LWNQATRNKVQIDNQDL